MVKTCDEQLITAKELWQSMITSKVYSFADLVPSDLEEKAGVYMIHIKETGEVLYVGRTINLRRRLYTNHLMGNKSTARLKKYLVEDNERYPQIMSYQNAKEFMKKHCCFRFILIEDGHMRGHVEGLFGFLADARYIELEH